MSAESLRARLRAATESGKTYIDTDGFTHHTFDPYKADLIAHAPTDLRLALDVIEAAKRLVDQRVITQDQVLDLEAALEAFEASP